VVKERWCKVQWYKGEEVPMQRWCMRDKETVLQTKCWTGSAEVKLQRGTVPGVQQEQEGQKLFRGDQVRQMQRCRGGQKLVKMCCSGSCEV